MGIVASDPEDVQILLKHEHSQKKPFVYKFPKDWVGEGILTAETHIWRKHRKLIVQAFNRKVLDHYMEIFIKQSNILVDQIAPHCGTDKNIDVFHYISRCTLDIICGKLSHFLYDFRGFQFLFFRGINGNKDKCTERR